MWTVPTRRSSPSTACFGLRALSTTPTHSILTQTCRGTRPVTILIDGTGLMWASWRLRGLFNDRGTAGRHGAAFHFMRTMIRITEDLCGDNVAFCLDGGHTSKSSVLPDYKHKATLAAEYGAKTFTEKQRADASQKPWTVSGDQVSRSVIQCQYVWTAVRTTARFTCALLCCFVVSGRPCQNLCSF
jgi:hypothetical protein